MILTGKAIRSAVADKSIVIDPFDDAQLNPNSYNYRLGDQVFAVGRSGCKRQRVPVSSEGRVLLERGRLYLSTTRERIGSDHYVTSLIGRSSVGRLGLFVQVAANIGHQGALHQWTLELFPAINIVLYIGQVLGQVSFWRPRGAARFYRGRYGTSDAPLPSKLLEPREFTE